jgi:lipopolysaccharide cholinephosphotransferase
MKKISPSSAKQIQIEVLVHLKKYCEENGIKYFLVFGTLLGAVRENGFIKWDYDIDVGMIRDDYEKFLEGYCDNESYEILRFNKNGYAGIIPKIAKKGTLRKPNWDKAGTEAFPIGIDIYPFDYVPGNPLSYFMFHFKHRILVLLHRIKKVQPAEWRGLYRNVAIKLLKILIKPINHSAIVDKYHSTCQQYVDNGHRKVRCLFVPWNKPVSKNDLANRDIIKFEGIEFYIPSGYDNWLKQAYGDYMIPPKADKQSVLIKKAEEEFTWMA